MNDQWKVLLLVLVLVAGISFATVPNPVSQVEFPLPGNEVVAITPSGIVIGRVLGREGLFLRLRHVTRVAAFNLKTGDTVVIDQARRGYIAEHRISEVYPWVHELPFDTTN
jgi:hypothetical protein